MSKKIAVLGGGSFGTVLANQAAQNNFQTYLWVKDTEHALRINSEGKNMKYHPELSLSPNIIASEKMDEVLKDASLIFIATPSKTIRSIVQRMKDFITNETLIVSCTKGLEGDPCMTISEIILDELSEHQGITIGALSGPNLAREIAQKKTAGAVIASASSVLRVEVDKALSSENFKIFMSEDMQGVELAGALKNIYAIISGYCHAVDVGENAIGLILTRALAEMGQFAKIKGASFSTFLGLAGVGDLVATCFSKLSRNYQLGWALGNGLTLTEAKETVGQVAEGLNTLEIVQAEIDGLDIKMPLLEAMHGIIYKKNEKNSLLKQLIMHSDNVDVKF